jgi:SRP40, C-terminal domain
VLIAASITHLLQVRGKDFRHEKTKKKRGTYKGGAIETGAVNSFKFESDED